ncbi:virion morphogenesis protein [Rhodovulum sp. P5]|uniref:tail completion or Neck1 protein n=1 Tax=Rhodovulum phage vB_RhkS_P1 TaxID=1873452 RepID=UPI00080A9F19|nr:phage virion morphogenesis protein [Rhodovulum sp. P5]YP_009285927.1 tail completion or Neck1 protein [Rhodovulum phage vB_RhkS_P1]ANT39913.1 virion morphogenesis protein [Rhodovulum phage vB_RhkS_P1]ARE38981.1 virion morphogenesis protein [Rhodovulum sp. P5]
MVTLTVTLDDVAARADLDRLEAASRDMTELMDQVGAVLVAGAQERIGQTNVTPGGVPWPQSLRAQLEGGLTLHDSGQLMRSITEQPGPQSVRVGSNIIYAGIHQTGGTIRAKTARGLRFTLANGETAVVGSVTIPARPYLGISDDERADIEGLTAAWFGAVLEEGRAR